MRLEGKVAAVTGGASGFGEAAGRLFAAEGARVVLGDIQRNRGVAVAESIGPAARFVSCDVTDETDVARLVDTAVDEFGRLDVMFNNAGIVGTVGPLVTTPAAEWKATVDVLLNGAFYGMKHAARVMAPRESGSIISTASTAGVAGGLGPHAYTAAKHAIVGLTKNAAAELCRHGIRVNCIAPHAMATPMAAMAFLGDPDAVDEVADEIAKTSPLKGRPGLATDVAQAALWLAGDESGYTSGLCLTTDAGFTAGARDAAPGHAERAPMMREAGRVGL